MRAAHGARVAIQGERGAFSHEAAVRLLGQDIQVVPRPTFDSLFAAMPEGAADYVLVPVENTLVGSVQRAQDLLLESPFPVVAEAVLPIRHHLIGSAGATLESVRVVESHPVALAQCERFFAAHPHLQRVAAEDTAGSVRAVVERRDPSRAAIAGRWAAEVHGGVVLQEHLEDHHENYTRFLLLGRAPLDGAQPDTLSLVLRLHHQPGALWHALEPFARRGLNLLKIESRPIHGRPWEYRFNVDVQTPPDDVEVAAALAELGSRVDHVRILGHYPSAPRTGLQPALAS